MEPDAVRLVEESLLRHERIQTQALVSQAISLRRIADAIEGNAEKYIGSVANAIERGIRGVGR